MPYASGVSSMASNARLRIAGRVTATVARLATGWAGSPLAGRGLHPLDDEPDFMSIIAPLTPFGPASPGRTGRPILCQASVDQRRVRTLEMAKHECQAGVFFFTPLYRRWSFHIRRMNGTIPTNQPQPSAVSR